MNEKKRRAGVNGRMHLKQLSLGICAQNKSQHQVFSSLIKMEAAKIDWAKMESVFAVDQVYEDINAPQWVDLLSPPPPQHDDVAWFCRPDCKHPCTAEDLLHSTPPLSASSKLLRSVSVSKLIGFVDWTRREPNLKRRGGAAAQSSSPDDDDDENQDPNHPSKAAIKSSARKPEEDSSSKNKSRLNASQSAKDLFGGGGKDLVDRFTEFCNDLKKMLQQTDEDEEEPPAVTNVVQKKKAMERVPFLELPKHRHQGGDSSSSPGKHKPNPRKNNNIKPAADAENTPVNIMKAEEKGVGVRTNPPTPQGFSGTPRAPKSRILERGVLDQVGPVSGQGRRVDVFWLFKPCTLSN